MFNLFTLLDTLSEDDKVLIYECDSTSIGNKRHFIDEQWILDIEDKVENFLFYIGPDYNCLKLYITGHDRSYKILEEGL